MTPLAGLIMAVVAGWFVRGPRLAAAIVVVPFLAVAGAQTWRIAAGDGTSPPGTVIGFPQAIGYWVIQAIFLALALGIAAELGFLRARRALPRDAAAGAGRAVIVAGILAVPTAVFVGLYVAGSSPVRHHAASGSPPAQGFLGIALCIAVLAALSVLTVRARRSAARAERAGAGAGAAVAGGRR
jgi:hypothetical protein